MLSFIQTLDAPWVRIVLAQQNSLEYSYSKPEKLRPPGALPLTRCPVEVAAAFRTRELALRCETFANMQPRLKLMRALLPSLRRLEPFDVVVGVHLRTGYTDWAFRNSASSFRQLRNQSSAEAAPSAESAVAPATQAAAQLPASAQAAKAGSPATDVWCTDAKRDLRVQPGQSWGRLTEAQIAEWKRRRCDRYFCMPSAMEAVGTYKCVPKPQLGAASAVATSTPTPASTSLASTSIASSPAPTSPERWSVLEHWARLDSYLLDCKQTPPARPQLASAPAAHSGSRRPSGINAVTAGGRGPCFNWQSPNGPKAPTIADGMQCHAGHAKPNFTLTGGAPDGTLAALLTCAGRIAQSISLLRRAESGGSSGSSGGSGSGGGGGGSGSGGDSGGSSETPVPAALPQTLLPYNQRKMPAWGLLVSSSPTRLPCPPLPRPGPLSQVGSLPAPARVGSATAALQRAALSTSVAAAATTAPSRAARGLDRSFVDFWLVASSRSVFGGSL